MNSVNGPFGQVFRASQSDDHDTGESVALTSTGWFASVVRGVDRLSNVCSLIGLWVAMLCLGGCVIYVFLGVLARKTGWFVLQGAEEFGGFALVLVFFLGLAHAFRSGVFVRVAPLEHYFPKVRRWFTIGQYLFVMVLAILLEYYYFNYFDVLRSSHQITLDVPQVSVFWPYLALVIGNLFFCVEVLAQLLKTLTGQLVTKSVGDHW